ncbi:GC-rich sequence DNA-binding factor [Phytophthora cactorum]|nr:GC-rich sequence DNA-binding factor [Phytophthora cactorum]
MFRSKKKKVDGRKRREVEAESENEAAAVSADVATSSTAEFRLLTTLRSRPAKSSMTFSSKRSSVGNTHTVVAATVHTETSGLLSFDDGERQTTQKKRKMRPNLVASSTVDVEMEETTSHEQSVLLPTKREETLEDVEMLEVEAGNDEEVERIIIEEEEQEEEGLFFLKEAKDETQQESLVEELSAEDEDDEQNRRWEEELMRRGGHRVPPTSESKGSRSRDGLPTYPTRRKVPCVSLGSVLGKLEKSLESTTFEDERASQELLVSSEEFEYFQEIEDFVKGLSFCLREKVPVIQAKEKNIIDERVQRVNATQEEEKRAVEEERAVSSSNDTHAARVLKYQQHFTESYVADPQQPDEDLFADAIDEINSLERVYGRFQEWKAKFPDVYKNTYCELAQEKFFAPYVQAELLYWDPLAVADAKTRLKSLDDFAWFRVLRQHKTSIDTVITPVEEKLDNGVNTALESFSSEAKRTVLVALNQHTAESNGDVSYSLAIWWNDSTRCKTTSSLYSSLSQKELSLLLDSAVCYKCYINSSRTFGIAKKRKVAASCYGYTGREAALRFLPSQERELKHMMELFTPFLQHAAQ